MHDDSNVIIGLVPSCLRRLGSLEITTIDVYYYYLSAAFRPRSHPNQADGVSVSLTSGCDYNK